MTIFHSRMDIVVIVLLAIISIWDLLKQEIPVSLLVMFSVSSVLQMLMREGVSGVSICLPMIILLAGGIFIVKKSIMGGGDVWVLICLVIAWPIELFWQSVMCGSLLLCIVALGILFFSKSDDIHVPMIPFLLLGYCM